jgi:Domain of unknown function (DUF1995)
MMTRMVRHPRRANPALGMLFFRQGTIIMTTSVFCWLLVVVATALVPQSPEEQTRLALRSLRKAIASSNDDVPKRFFVDYLIPLPRDTKPEDIDPWPGGLAQMYPYGEQIVTDLLRGLVEEPAGACSSQIVSASDCCGFFVQESLTSARNDMAAILFPGVDQLDTIQDIDTMVGPYRTLLLVNRQFQRPVDFGFTNKDRAQQQLFDRYTWGFAFQELACRGEDVKLTFEYPNWEACVVCDEDVDMGSQQRKLLTPSPQRPVYEALEQEINKVLPEPLWMRKMGEADRKGFKFQRQQRSGNNNNP